MSDPTLVEQVLRNRLTPSENFAAELGKKSATITMQELKIERLKAQIAALTADNERLREALKPFAECVVHLHPAHEPEDTTLDGIKVREWRAAYEVFTATDPALTAEPAQGGAA